MAVTLFSCNEPDNSNPGLTGDYVLITTAIKTSTGSRNKFQEKFAVALDSFFLKDDPLISLQEQKNLLETAKMENKKAESLVFAANEIDSSYRYKKAAVSLFAFLDNQYNKSFPAMFAIMESNAPDKKSLILTILKPSLDTLKIKATETIDLANAIKQKYKLHLVDLMPD